MGLWNFISFGLRIVFWIKVEWSAGLGVGSGVEGVYDCVRDRTRIGCEIRWHLVWCGMGCRLLSDRLWEHTVGSCVKLGVVWGVGLSSRIGNIFTARIRRMEEGNISSLCVSSHPTCTPSTNWGVHIRSLWGVPHPS